MDNKNLAPEPGLYVTATPIGNLGDMTYRAVRLLQSADLILCEDTRQTAKLCQAYDIATPRRPYHDHNAEKVRPGVVEELKNGAAICLVSDAGTPLISDPGVKLVQAARAAGVAVYAVPGACAAIAALSVVAPPSDKFLFAGFPPPKPDARRAFLSALRGVDAALVFYEAPQRLAASLRDMAASLGDRRAAVARELTKLHEEVASGVLSDLAASYEESPPRGEIVVVVDPPAHKAADAETIDAFLRDALLSGSVKDAAQAAAETFDMPRKDAYARALEIKNGDA